MEGAFEKEDTNWKEAPEIVQDELRKPVLIRRHAQSDEIIWILEPLLTRPPKLRRRVRFMRVREPFSHALYSRRSRRLGVQQRLVDSECSIYFPPLLSFEISERWVKLSISAYGIPLFSI